MARPRKYACQVDDELTHFIDRHKKLFADIGDYRVRCDLLAGLALALVSNEQPHLDGSIVTDLPVPITSKLLDALNNLVALSSKYLDFYQRYLMEREYACHRSSLIAMLLSRIYERLWLVEAPGRARQALGVYFTPPHLAYFVAGRALCDAPPDCTVFDPCMGSGNLLLAALDLLDTGSVPRLETICRRLRGLELSGEILELSGLLAAVSCLERVRLDDARARLDLCRRAVRQAGCFSQGDMLTATDLQSAMAESVVALLNPPWEGPASLFVERLLDRTFDRACLITPTSLWHDAGALPLRRQIFERGLLSELYGFTNADHAFDMHASQKYTVAVISRRRHDSVIWSGGDNILSKLVYPPPLASSFKDSDCTGFASSIGGTLYILPVSQDQEQIDILRYIAAHNPPLSSMVGTARICKDVAPIFLMSREFDMTMDRRHFVTAAQAADLGFVAGRAVDKPIFLHRGQCRLLPLIEGRMLGHFDHWAKSYRSGHGRSACWIKDGGRQSQYLIDSDIARERWYDSLKIGFQSIGSSSNKRTMVASLIDGYPCGNSVSVIYLSDSKRYKPDLLEFFAGVLNSFVFDFQLRARLSGTNINYYLLQDCRLPSVLAQIASGEIVDDDQKVLFDLSLALVRSLTAQPGRDRLAILDAVIARLYQLDSEQYKKCLSLDRDNCSVVSASGFYRVDSELLPAERLPALCLSEYLRLEQFGVEHYVDYALQILDGQCARV